MTVEKRTSDSGEEFPVGMRVLAVDDDPTCLVVLENLLRKCQYHGLNLLLLLLLAVIHDLGFWFVLCYFF